MTRLRLLVALLVIVSFAVTIAQGSGPPSSGAHDPGVRGGAAGAGGNLSALTSDQATFFDAGLDAFLEVDGVADGLGPRFNLDSCAACHAQPAVGRSSPAVNPQVAVATAFGAQNVVPSFIQLHGPCGRRGSSGRPTGRPTEAFTRSS